MTTSEVHKDYQQVLTEHFYLFSKYISASDFVDRLISDGVLTVDDKEIILNPYAHQSRRERATKLIEVLLTRGVNGYNKFLEILEYQYPHVYKEVSGKTPRPPPAGFLRNRISDRLQMINDLPRLAQHIKEQYNQNTELHEELTVLEGLLQLSKEENADLERDIESLKHIKHRNEDLMIKINNLENDNKDLQTNINRDMQRMLKYIEERDEYMEKCQNLQIKYDQLFHKYKELEQNKTEESPPSRQEPAAKPSLKPQLDASLAETRSQHTYAELQILRDKLDEYMSHSEDMSRRLHESEENVKSLEGKLVYSTKEMNKHYREHRKLDEHLKVAQLKAEGCFKLSQRQHDEIMELNRQKLRDQERITKMTDENNQLFREKYTLETDLEKVRMELDKMMARSSLDLSCQFSGSDEDNSSRAPEDAEAADADNDEDEEQVPPPFFKRHHRVPHPFFNRHQRYIRKPVRRRKRRKVLPKRPIPDFDSAEMGKASTLPSGSETPGMMFQREIAYFRYSKKEFRKPVGLIAQDSMTVNHGSTYDKDPRVIKSEPPTDREMLAAGYQSDKASNSTVYIARTAAPRSERRPSSPPDELCPENFVSDGTDSSGELSLVDDFPPYDLMAEMLPKQCAQVTSSGAPESSLYRTVVVKFPVVNDKASDGKAAVEIVGGNHTGIFISKVFHKGVDLSEGEEIKQIIYTPTEKAKAVETTLQGCTLEDTYRLLSEEYIRPRKEREVKLRVRKCRPEYDSACKWITENRGTGDFLFVRCNVRLDHRGDDSLQLKPGDIFQVKNSRYSRKQWLGYRVNEATAKVDTTHEVKIPNPQEANLKRLPSFDGSDRTTKRNAVRVRGATYERVLPMKATVNLPVHVVGHPMVVNAMLDLIAKHLSNTEFFVKSSDGGSLSDQESKHSRKDIHLVKRCSMERLFVSKPFQRILVFVNVTDMMEPETFCNLFDTVLAGKIGTDVLTASKNLKLKLSHGEYKYEELCVPAISTKERLLDSFKKKVASAQGRTLWLNSRDMDSVVADHYPKYLGQKCDLNKIMSAVQRAQSYDHN